MNCCFKPLPPPSLFTSSHFPFKFPSLSLLSLSQELMAKSFIRNPGQSNLVRVGVGREGIFKLDSKMDKVGGACCHW